MFLCNSLFLELLQKLTDFVLNLKFITHFRGGTKLKLLRQFILNSPRFINQQIIHILQNLVYAGVLFL